MATNSSRQLRFGLLSLATIGLSALSPYAHGAGKSVAIRALEATDDFKIIMYTRVFESENKVAYPVATMDRDAFRLELGRKLKASIKPESLTTFGSSAQPRSRRLVMALPLAIDIPKQFLDEVRETIAENLPAARSEYFALLSVTMEGVAGLATATPGESDNFRAFQRTLLEAKPSGTAPGIDQMVCVAAATFKEWSRYAEKTGEQKGLVLLGHPSVATTADLKRLEGCLGELSRAAVPVFLLATKGVSGKPVDAGASFSKPELVSGGFVQNVSSRVDLYPALLNTLANLNEEYVATFNLYPLIGTWDGRSAISEEGQTFFNLSVSYHGENVSTGMLSMHVPGPWQENITQINKSRSIWEKLARSAMDLNSTERAVAGLLLVVLLAAGAFTARYTWLSARILLRTVRCRTCGLRVKGSFSNCPYRGDNLAGWFSVLSGPGIGMVLPVRQGRNVVGTGGGCDVHLGGNSGVRRKHAEIIVENGKAQLRLLHAATQLKALDRVNGFPIVEPRLICNGDVLSLGSVQLRFEAKSLAG